MTEFDATQPVPEQVQNEPTSPTVMDPDAGQRLYNSAKTPQGPGTGSTAPPAEPSFTPSAADNMAIHGQEHAPGTFQSIMANGAGDLVKAGMQPLTAVFAASLHALDTLKNEKPPQEDAGQRAGGIIDRFFAPLRGQAGAIGGAGNAAAARQAQTEAVQKQKLADFNEQHKQKMDDIKEGVNIAISNAQMIHSQFLLHQLQTKELDDNIALGKGAVELLDKQPVKGVVLGQDIDSDEIKRQVAQHTADPNTGLDLSKATPYLTGRKQVGTDENGNPQYRGTYTVVKLPPEVRITTPEDAKLYFPEAKGLDNVSEEHPLVVPGSLYNARYQANETAQAVRGKTQQVLDSVEEIKDQHLQMKESKDFAGLNIWQQDLATASRDPRYKDNPAAQYLAARQMILANPPKDANGKPYSNLDRDIQDQLPGKTPQERQKVFDSIMLEGQRAAAARDLEIQKAKDKQDAEAATLQTQAGQIGAVSTPEMAAKIAALPPEMQKVMDTVPANNRAAIYAIAFGPGDLSLDTFPVTPRKGVPIISRAAAADAIKLLNPRWNEQQYKKMGEAYSDLIHGKDGQAIQQYNNVLGHGAEAYDIVNEINRKTPKIWNTPLNKAEKEFGGETATRLTTALLPVRGEIELLLAGGYSPKGPEADAFNEVLNPASTPGQINSALKIIGSVGAIRLENINQNYKRVSGIDVPGILTQDTMESAKRMGLDPLTMSRLQRLNIGDTMFYNPNYKPETPQQAVNSQQQKDATTKAQMAANTAGNTPPTGYTHSAVIPGTKITVYAMPNGTIVDAQGNKYDANGKRLQP